MREFRGRWMRLAWPAGLMLAAAGLFVAYLEQATRDTYVTSDGGSIALQAWDMLHGNLLLHGWALADVSFYTVDLPQYMLVEAVRGLGPDVVHICAALTYTLLTLLAGWLAKGRTAGREGVARFLVAAGIMLAPQLGLPTGILLLSPDHVGTGIPLLLTWAVLDRGDDPPKPPRFRGDPSPRPPLGVPVVVCVLLAWTAVGDPLAEAIGALPLAAVCAMRVSQGVVLRRDRRDNWYQLSLLVAAVVSVPTAWAVTRLIAAAGGWTERAVQTSLAGSGVLRRNAALTGDGILQLFGADFRGQPTHLLAAFAIVHLIGVALVAWAFLLAVRHFFAGELIVQVLTTAIVVNLAAYMFSVQAQDITRTREIAAVLPFGAVLAGRLLARPLLAARLAPVMAVVLAGYAGMLVFDAAQPPVPAPTAHLAAWLAGHDLTHGLAGYWQANSVTLYSGDRVQVRAVGLNNDGQLTGRTWWEASQAWYDPATHDAGFLISDAPPWRWQDQPLIQRMEAEAGRPARVYQVGPYTIAVWHQNLLARLH